MGPLCGGGGRREVGESKEGGNGGESSRGEGGEEQPYQS